MRSASEVFLTSSGVSVFVWALSNRNDTVKINLVTSNIFSNISDDWICSNNFLVLTRSCIFFHSTCYKSNDRKKENEQCNDFFIRSSNLLALISFYLNVTFSSFKISLLRRDKETGLKEAGVDVSIDAGSCQEIEAIADKSPTTEASLDLMKENHAFLGHRDKLSQLEWHSIATIRMVPTLCMASDWRQGSRAIHEQVVVEIDGHSMASAKSRQRIKSIVV